MSRSLREGDSSQGMAPPLVGELPLLYYSQLYQILILSDMVASTGSAKWVRSGMDGTNRIRRFQVASHRTVSSQLHTTFWVVVTQVSGSPRSRQSSYIEGTAQESMYEESHHRRRTVCSRTTL